MDFHKTSFEEYVRMVNQINQYLESNNRTLDEEYDLVIQKKSELSRRLRDCVEFIKLNNLHQKDVDIEVKE